MNVPVPRLTCASNEVNDCVNINTVTLAERIWMNKLIEHNNHARGIVERIMCPYKIEDM